jgi:4-hydroxy-tetrahydrodipicolinate reductase
VTAKPIRVVIAGINGRMGRASAALIHADNDLELIGAVGRPGASYVGQDVGKMTNSGSAGILVSNEIKGLLTGAKADVLLDFSLSESAFEHAQLALANNVRPVIGTSGIGEEQIKTLAKLADSKRLGAMVVPNFSVGAVLMMEFARQAGAFFTNAEIVEMHHTKKVDAPSGTAMHTVAKMAKSGNTFNKKEVDEKELLAGARGGQGTGGVRVHSLRLPGLISHQEVIFGGPGELLTIRHDSFNTDCFLNGIALAIKAVVDLDHFVLGLENVLNIAGSERVAAKA